MKTRQEYIFDAALSIHRRIAAACQSCGRDIAEVAVVGAAKTFPAADTRTAAECGIVNIGENYLQEARDKMTQCEGLPIVWHYLGRLQSNKAAAVAKLFDYIHSVDDAAVAKKLSAARAPLGKPLSVFVQVNIDGEASKGGVSPKAAAVLAGEITAMPHLVVEGLMCMPNPAGDAGNAFLALRRLRDSINDECKMQMGGLSMGMSGDYEKAIAEGATHLRLGTALFGARPPKSG